MSAPPSPPATLVAQRLSLARGQRVVLRDLSLTVPPHARVGVVGANGVGKSTLLSVLAGLVEADSGTVRIDPPSATVGLLAQEHRHRPDETVRQLLTRRTGVAEAEAELAEAAGDLETARLGADARYARALERFVRVSDGDVDARIDAALADLGVPGLAEQATTRLSGGQVSKVALAAIVLSRFDVTLLDEPTNDLDFAGLERLEQFVAEQRGGMVIVSHDREFLEGAVDSVLELDEHTHAATLFGGGWLAYLDQRETNRRHAEEAYRVYTV
ncbi:MAG TPA: ATP-binding cassette domain-containing protein, partial [Acidimicrobiales bacterium]|nr:ATP-binding cassette domain-containing protein [Acidimicrobiales bacterium]